MSFYKKHAPNHREHARRPSGPEPVRRDEGSARRGRHPLGLRGEGEEADQGAGTGAGRLHRGQERDQLLPARQHAALVGHQHVPEGALPRGRPQGGRVRRRVRGRAVRHRLHVPHGDAVRAAGDPADLGAVPEVQLRARDRPERDARHVRRRRHLLPGQHHQGPRPDHQGRRAHPVAGNVADDHGRRPLDRLSLRPRRGPVRGRERGHHPHRPSRGHAGQGHGRDHAHMSVVPRHQHPELPAEEPGAVGDRRLAGAPCRA